MSDTSLIMYMISYAMVADKRVSIEDAVFEPAASDPWSSGESVLFNICGCNMLSRSRLAIARADHYLSGIC